MPGKDAKKVVVSEPPSACKWWWSLISVVVVGLVMMPFTYKVVDGIVRSLTGLRVASASGCPTAFGLVLHLVVVFLALRGVMELKL
jgi:hypothetical protein